jgi:Zn-dependent protease
MSQYDQRYEPRSFPEPDPDYSPIRRRRSARELLAKLAAPLVLVIGLLVKFGAFSLKFFGIFLAIGGYALIWGWRFAVGFVALILVHELGHFFEARRQGLHPSLPVFIPFLGAYVAIKDAPFDPWRNALISIWGPIAGGLAALAALLLGEALDSRLLLALAYAGFFLNLFNLIPIGFLDGGFIARSFRLLRRGAGDRDPERARRRGWIVAILYGAVALALVAGMVVAHVPQDRL